MKKQKYFILLFFFFFIYNILNAQRVDNLEPVGSYYFWKTKDLLNEGMANHQTVQILVFPVYNGTESLLAIELDTCNLRNTDFKWDNAKYHLVYYKIKYVTKENRKTQEIDSLIKYKKEINTSCVKLIEKLFDSAIKQTKYSENFGLDGMRYVFTSGYGRYAGMYWGAGLPSKDTKLGKLVNIANELFKTIKSDTNYIEFDKDFIIKIGNLTEEFNLTNANIGS